MEIYRHLANLREADHPIITKVAEVEPDPDFLNTIEPWHKPAPYGRIWTLSTGILSHDEIDDTYVLFHYPGTTKPHWAKKYREIHAETQLHKTPQDHRHRTRLTHPPRRRHGHQNRPKNGRQLLNNLLRDHPVPAWKLTDQEIETLTKLYEVVTKHVEKQFKKGIEEAARN
ncbi:hypothetical protein [Methanopyrus kandleri]